MPPTELDLAVADLAAVAFVGTPEEVDAKLERVEALNTDEAVDRREAEGHPAMRGLGYLCADLRNATLDDPVAYREASKELLSDWMSDMDPALESRLERAVDDDPLDLAWNRMWDHYESLWARTFNALAEPVGGSLLAGVAIAPLKLANSLTHWAASMYSQPKISVYERQALAHRKRYLARHPEASDAEAVRETVESAQEDLDEMLAERLVEKSWASLAAGSYWLAEMQAGNALRIHPGDEDAGIAAAVAANRREWLDEQRGKSEGADAELPLDLRPGALDAIGEGDDRALARLLESMLASSKVVEVSGFAEPEVRARAAAERELLYQVMDQARLLEESDPEGPLADEARYVQALAQNDLGYEAESWGKLEGLGQEKNTESNMGRHAQALLRDPWQNTYGNFERQRRRAVEKDVAFRLFGGHAFGQRYPELPFGLSYLVEAPAIVQTLITAPVRLLFGPWEPQGKDLYRAPATAGYRYLAREPRGEHTRQVAEWLYDYETERGRWGRALRLYDLQDETDPVERMALAEKAAERKLASASRAPRRDWRGSILRGVVRQFPDSDAGNQAGFRLRQEVETLSPQRIRVTRSFLEENPNVAGPYGMALNPILLDGETGNGELHPRGVTFLGGEVMEFALVPESGDEDDEPFTVRKKIERERLSQAVALLDETVLKNDQLDEFDAVRPDAFRDHYMERARLGLTSKPDLRPSAESVYVYESLREQYGVVRGRESILPFDLVFQGSVQDFSLGAFPRWRQPRRTPDAFLYE